MVFSINIYNFFVVQSTCEVLSTKLRKVYDELDDVEKPRSQRLCEKTRALVAQVYSYFSHISQILGPDIDAMSNAVRQTALATALNEKTVKSIIAERPVHPLLQKIDPLPPCKTVSPKKPTPVEEGEKIVSYLSPVLLEQINKIIHDHYQKGRRVNLRELNELLKKELEHLDYQYSHVSLWKILLALGFRYRKVSNRTIIFEKPDLIRKRHVYLRKIKQLRRANAYFAFADETWIFQGMKASKDWIDTKAYG